MRDLLITAIVFGSLPFILRRPQIGVMMYIWISVMNPHRLAWGFAYSFNFAEIVAIATLVATLISKDLKPPPMMFLVVVQIAFALWISVTTLFALYPHEAFEMWKTMMKTQLMALLIPMLFHKKEDIRRLLFVVVFCIAFYGIKGGAFMLAT